MVLPNPTPTEPLPAEIEAYCVKCKVPRTMTGAHLETTKNGRLAAKGTCPVCGTTMMKFLSGA